MRRSNPTRLLLSAALLCAALAQSVADTTCPTPTNRQPDLCGGPGVGVCGMDGICSCELEYAGADCSQCSPGYVERLQAGWGPASTACVPVSATEGPQPMAAPVVGPASGGMSSRRRSLLIAVIVVTALGVVLAALVLALYLRVRSLRARLSKPRPSRIPIEEIEKASAASNLNSNGPQSLRPPGSKGTDLEGSSTVLTIMSNPLALHAAPPEGGTSKGTGAAAPGEEPPKDAGVKGGEGE